MSDLNVGSASPPTADAPTRDRVISVRVTPDLAGRLERAAAQRGWDVSAYVRTLIVGATAMLDLDQTITATAPLRELELRRAAPQCPITFQCPGCHCVRDTGHAGLCDVYCGDSPKRSLAR